MDDEHHNMHAQNKKPGEHIALDMKCPLRQRIQESISLWGMI